MNEKPKSRRKSSRTSKIKIYIYAQYLKISLFNWDLKKIVN